MRRWAQHLAVVLATGYILFFLAWLVLGRVGPEWFRPGRFELPVLLAVVALCFQTS
jgi:hypothetical protein